MAPQVKTYLKPIEIRKTSTRQNESKKMSDENKLESNVAQYELEIAIDAPPETVWKALTDETNAWWLPDFHMVSPNSTVTFEAHAGGHLMEQCEDGGSLLWYTVQCCQPQQHTIYLIGHTAPDWGGPSTSHLKLSVVAGDDGGSVFKVTDGQMGRVTKVSVERVQSGWNNLFTDGLKQYVETAQGKG